MATRRVLDFRPRYDNEVLDRLARQAGEVLAPVFEANGWPMPVLGGGLNEIPSAVEIALTVRRLLSTTAQNEQDIAEIVEPIWVNRNRDDELRVYLEVGVVLPLRDEWS
jgi:hypothetical protein